MGFLLLLFCCACVLEKPYICVNIWLLSTRPLRRSLVTARGYSLAAPRAVGDPALAGGLDWVTHRGPCQPQTFCDSVLCCTGCQQLLGGRSFPEDARLLSAKPSVRVDSITLSAKFIIFS